jgi:hypothetical protein
VSGDHAHDVRFLHDQEFLAVELDLSPGPFAKQHAIAWLQIDRDQLATLVAPSGTDGNDLAFLWFLFGGVGNDDPPFVFPASMRRTTTRSCSGRNLVLAMGFLVVVRVP